MPKGIVKFVIRTVPVLLSLLLISVLVGLGYYYLSFSLPQETYQLSRVGGWGKLNARILSFESEKGFKGAKNHLYDLLQDKSFVVSAIPYYLLASIFDAKGQYQEAKTTYLAMIQVATMNPLNEAKYRYYLQDAHASLALIDYRKGKIKNAFKELSQVPDVTQLENPKLWIALKDVLSDPKRADFHFELGKALRERLELPEARHEFELALADSYDPELKLDVSNVLLAKMPRKTQSLPALSRYQALRASHLEDLAAQTKDLKQKKRLQNKAIRLYETMLSQSPDFEWGYQQIAHLYMEQERFSQARHYAETAVAYNPDLYLSRLSLGDIALAQGSYEEAHQQFSQAQKTLASLTDRHHRVLLVNVENQLGFTQELLEHSKEALGHYKAALAIADSLEEADPADLAYARDGIQRIQNQSHLLASKY